MKLVNEKILELIKKLKQLYFLTQYFINWTILSFTGLIYINMMCHAGCQDNSFIKKNLGY